LTQQGTAVGPCHSEEHRPLLEALDLWLSPEFRADYRLDGRNWRRVTASSEKFPPDIPDEPRGAGRFLFEAYNGHRVVDSSFPPQLPLEARLGFARAAAVAFPASDGNHWARVYAWHHERRSDYLDDNAFGAARGFWASLLATSKDPSVLWCALADYVVRQARLPLPGGPRAARRELYQRQLADCATWFQPIISLPRSTRLEPEKQIDIHGFEGLARDARYNQELGVFPAWAFDVARLYGADFAFDLDCHLLQRAFAGFLGTTAETRGQSLSLNVHMSSLAEEHRSSLRKRLDDILREYPTNCDFCLELTEREELPVGDEEDYVAAAFRFGRETRQLVTSLVIDDFGVGYTSLIRVICLLPSSIKIDKNLRHFFAVKGPINPGRYVDTILRSAQDVLKLGPLPSVLTIEGLELDSSHARALLEVAFK